MDWTALGVTLKLAVWTVLCLIALGLPLAYWLANTKFRGKALIESVVALPLVLPPTVLGFYLLMATGPRSPVGRGLESISGERLPFTFGGILLGSILFNLPFAVRPFASAFAAVDRKLLEAAWCLGASRVATVWRVVIPLAWPGLLTGIVLTFAHTMGEFGVVLMIGGNIPGVTRTLSIAIYDDVQALNYQSAGQAAAVLVAVSFLALCAAYALQRRVTPP